MTSIKCTIIRSCHNYTIKFAAHFNHILRNGLVLHFRVGLRGFYIRVTEHLRDGFYRHMVVELKTGESMARDVRCQLFGDTSKVGDFLQVAVASLV